jgi:hypothetical protein
MINQTISHYGNVVVCIGQNPDTPTNCVGDLDCRLDVAYPLTIHSDCVDRHFRTQLGLGIFLRLDQLLSCPGGIRQESEVARIGPTALTIEPDERKMPRLA